MNSEIVLKDFNLEVAAKCARVEHSLVPLLAVLLSEQDVFSQCQVLDPRFLREEAETLTAHSIWHIEQLMLQKMIVILARWHLSGARHFDVPDVLVHLSENRTEKRTLSASDLPDHSNQFSLKPTVSKIPSSQ